MFHLISKDTEMIRETKWNAAKLGRYLEGDFVKEVDRNTEKVMETNRALTFLSVFGMFQEPKGNCTRCGKGQMKLYADVSHKEGIIVKCSSGSCKEKRGAFKGLWFEGVHMPLKKIIYLIYYWAKKRTGCEVADELECTSPNTVVDHYNFLREVCEESLMNKGIKKIGGPGLHVEIDESMFRSRKYHKGRKRSGEGWVFGGICRESDQCFLIYVADRTANTLINLINNYIASGTTIISDGWKSYVSLKNDPNFKDPSCHTNKVEGMWHHAKSSTPMTGTTAEMQQSYLYEFMWRKTKINKDKFAEILYDIGAIYQYEVYTDESHNKLIMNILQEQEAPSLHIPIKSLEQKIWNKVGLCAKNVTTVREITRKVGHGIKTDEVKEILQNMNLGNEDRGVMYLDKSMKNGIKTTTIVKILPGKISDNWLMKMNVARKKYNELYKKGIKENEHDDKIFTMAYTESELEELQQLKDELTETISSEKDDDLDI